MNVTGTLPAARAFTIEGSQRGCPGYDLPWDFRAPRIPHQDVGPGNAFRVEPEIVGTGQFRREVIVSRGIFAYDDLPTLELNPSQGFGIRFPSALAHLRRGRFHEAFIPERVLNEGEVLLGPDVFKPALQFFQQRERLLGFRQPCRDNGMSCLCFLVPFEILSGVLNRRPLLFQQYCLRCPVMPRQFRRCHPGRQLMQMGQDQVSGAFKLVGPAGIGEILQEGSPFTH